MFGYIAVNKAEMKFKEFDIYHSYYCGLCRALKKRYGVAGQLSLSYDMNFAYILLSSLYEPDNTLEMQRCIVHPFEKHLACTNEIAEYIADMNVLLAMYKCEDDWLDDRNLIKLAYGQLLKLKSKKQRDFYRKKIAAIRESLRVLREAEKSDNTDIDYMSGLFGNIMAQVMVYQEDEWAQILGNMGYALGKFIYILDAYEDVPEDIANGRYNPLRERYDEVDFEEQSVTILTLMMAECCKAFEQLPIIENIDILRNILYSGVWGKFELVHEKRKTAAKGVEE